MTVVELLYFHDYFNWLRKFVTKSDVHMAEYNEVLLFLHHRPFQAVLNRDLNRLRDGINLRRRFCLEFHIDVQDLNDAFECSVLEMLVALAIRIDDEYIGDPSEPEPGKIFWEMLRNLGIIYRRGLKYAASNRFLPAAMAQDIDLRLDIWMNRRFDRNGMGSIFPLRHAEVDQREAEIWSQMQAYLSENYD